MKESQGLKYHEVTVTYMPEYLLCNSRLLDVIKFKVKQVPQISLFRDVNFIKMHEFACRQDGETRIL